PQEGQPWEKGFMSIEEQLQYKFLLCIEGNDVATNLKWAMSSNSLVIMSKPKYETWFMEGKLEAGIHYVEVQDDYSDLPEKMDYYLANEQEALAIIENAHQWVEQFKDKRKERLISLMVADKYFTLSHQQ
ncbi:glycosyl transferase family 90, partial [Vibrio parahaemolyticus]|nr:glycosyl transferase family 90 [Vibrio parahaemolyticus]